jgi:hypothetical protein
MNPFFFWSFAAHFSFHYLRASSLTFFFSSSFFYFSPGLSSSFLGAVLGGSTFLVDG